jgi:transcriptional regulator GlxA family with amidase domain
VARKIVFLLLGGMKMLDVTRPAEVFAEANLFGADYLISYVSASGKPVMTCVGIRLPIDGMPEDAVGAGTMVVAGEMCWFSAGCLVSWWLRFRGCEAPGGSCRFAPGRSRWPRPGC